MTHAARRLAILAGAPAALSWPAAANAAPITFTFQGTATVIGGSGLFGTVAGEEIAFTGSFTVDDVETGIDPTPNTGVYTCGGCGATAFTVISPSLNGGLPLEWSDARVVVRPLSNSLQIDAAGVPPAGLTFAAFTINLSYPAGLIPDDSLPLSLMFPELVGNQVRSSMGDDLLSVGLLGQLTDPTTAVPEPASLLLLVTGLGVLAVRGRRRPGPA